ncbi:MAG: 4-hydroxybenzoate octaprenyltransferase [Chromatiaceae bacterium]|nr:4-hydroxybenzoate octaprenyltransferase [Chromatiaceae bacterium]MCP5408040.1 4-hydroxybenzoate octaprenyltransferase [Chromatiaceae bacterium]MCP5442939.1 4-hydroxybenzoate octaprenyltransferase [Chromatiaceae bacterium]
MIRPEIKLRLNLEPLSLRERLFAYAVLVRLNRPIGILLLLWPALWALWIAGNGQPRWEVVLIFILGVALMRSAGCAINDYADRNIDGRVARTRHRPLAVGLISPKEAIAVFALLSLVAFGLVLLLDWKTISMSFAAVALAALYPFMKRFTHLPQLVLGMAFGWAVPMAFMALTGGVSDAGWLLYLAAIIWALIYDTEYAMVDREDDIKIGVKSTAILFGEYDRLMIGLLQLTMLALLIMVGSKLELGLYYQLGVAIGGGMFLRQQIMIRKREPKRCFEAFLDNNGFGMIIFIGLVLDYLLSVHG